MKKSKFRLFVALLFLSLPAFGQNFVTVVASQIRNGGSALLPSGTITFQAVGTNNLPISYQVGGGGQQILMPTVCPITNGGIAGVCNVANVLLTQPQNICFNVTVKNSSGQVVIGGTNSGYNCLQPTQNNTWCVAAVCNFDNYAPRTPSTILTIIMPFPSTQTLGGVYAADCAAGTVQIGINMSGFPDCGPGGGGGGGGVWGSITGTLSNQVDLWTYLQTLAPLISPVLAGLPTTPNPPTNDSSNQIANTNWIRQQQFAPTVSPNFTGVPTVPTQSLSDSSTEAVNSAWVNGQHYGTGSGNVTGPVSSIIGHIVTFGSTNGQTLLDSSIAFPIAPANIGTLLAGQNGLANSATTDTTNASNITSGTLGAARLPLPSASTAGAVKSYTAIAHQWLNGLSTSGTFTGSQPACSDLSNGAPSCSTDTTNATNIASGTLAIARLGTLVAGQNGLANSATTDTTNAANIATGTLAGARMSAVNLGLSGNGGVTGTLPAGQVSSGYPFGSLSGTGSVLQAAAPVTLTFASTTTWAVGSVPLAIASLTLTGNTTLNFTGLATAGNYVIKLKQDSTGGRTVTAGTGCTWLVSGGGGGAVILTPTANALDEMSFIYDGTNCLINVAKNLN